MEQPPRHLRLSSIFIYAYMHHTYQNTILPENSFQFLCAFIHRNEIDNVDVRYFQCMLCFLDSLLSNKNSQQWTKKWHLNTYLPMGLQLKTYIFTQMQEALPELFLLILANIVILRATAWAFCYYAPPSL